MNDLHGIDFAAVATGRAEHSYLIRYHVQAPTNLAAVERAVAMLRRDVHLIALDRAENKGGDAWDVTLKVWEEA